MGEIDFTVLKINGHSIKDFSEDGDDAAIQAFLKCNDPIQIEVQQLQASSLNSSKTSQKASLVLTLRRHCMAISNSNCVQQQVIKSTQDQETQTISDLNSKYDDELGVDYIDEEENNGNASIVAANNERLIEEEHVIFDQCLAPEIDIEEVTLRKSASNELLGLSIIYSGNDSGGSKTNSGGSNNGGGGVGGGGGSGSENNNDVCAEIYISHIEKESVAGRDGRLRQGDQILQINGKDIKTKEETETLIAENNNAVTLLVSRYLYTDEDDFNDPSLVVDIDVEDEIVDENETETDDGDEDGDEELYVENNSTYENCLAATRDNVHLVNNLDRVFITEEKFRRVNDSSHQATGLESYDEGSNILSTIRKKSLKSVVPVDNTEETCKNNQRENAVSDIDSSRSGKRIVLNIERQQKSVVGGGAGITNNKTGFNEKLTKVIDSDTEHIYETIPEDSDAEPFYCSPYESSTYVNAIDTCSSTSTSAGNGGGGGVFQLQQRQKQRVAQWLGLCSAASAAAAVAPTNSSLFPRKTIPMRNRNFVAPKEPTMGRYGGPTIGVGGDTVRSIVTVTTNGSSSSGGGGGGGGGGAADGTVLNNYQDEQDNSSSAYNTGGSNASANQTINEATFLTKVLLQEEISSTPLSTRAIKKLQQVTPKDKEKLNSKGAILLAQDVSKNYCSTRTGCEELSIPDTLIRMYPPLSSQSQSVEKKHSIKDLSTQPSCNKSQLSVQTDHLPRAVSMLCPHFTAPNLRQYRFVSSQEVSALQPTTTTTTTTTAAVSKDSFSKIDQCQNPQKQQQQQPPMVWKVKRRPDGTRYIVRRPAVTFVNGGAETTTTTTTTANLSNRLRGGQRNFEHAPRNCDATTTEDDTISEVKTGRYWSKEERKKHVERARERRLHQQQQQQQQHFEQDIIEGTTMFFSEKMVARLQQHRNRNRQKHQMLKIQYQDLQFGGGSGVNHKTPSSSSQIKACAPAGTNCDLLQSVVAGIKHPPPPPTTFKSNSLSRAPPHQHQHQHVILVNTNEDIKANTVPVAADENDFSEVKCSSPP